jgi:hypothetical protein
MLHLTMKLLADIIGDKQILEDERSLNVNCGKYKWRRKLARMKYALSTLHSCYWLSGSPIGGQLIMSAYRTDRSYLK